MRTLDLRRTVLFFAACLVASAAAAQAQQIHEATTVQTFPAVELANGKYTTCGVRVLFSNSVSADDVEMYDLTVALYAGDSHQDPVTAVRATLRRGNLARNPNLQGSPMKAPLDLVFGIKTLPDPIALRDRSTQERTLIALVDESKARRPGDIGGPLIRQFTQGEPVLLFWTADPTDQRAFRVRALPDQDLIATVQACTRALARPGHEAPDHS